MNYKRATKDFNNHWNDQPNLFGNNVNRGKEEEILADEDFELIFLSFTNGG